MSPRLLVLDLDGTALTRDKRVSERDQAAAQALREHGVHVSVATGRLFTGTQRAARDLGVRGNVAVMNGSELVDVDSGRVELGRYLSRGSTQTARSLLSEGDLHGILFRSGGLHYGRRSLLFRPYLADWTEDHDVHEDLHLAEAWQARDLLSVGIAGPRHQVAELRASLERALAPEEGLVEFDTHSGERFLSLRHRQETKGTAVRRLAEERGLSIEQTVVVGDWLNDVSMFRAAGRSFCMGGALPEVAAEADEVLEAQRHDGGAVAEVARRVWGLEV